MLMNVTQMMVIVSTLVPIMMEVTPAPALLVMNSILIRGLVMVSIVKALNINKTSPE